MKRNGIPRRKVLAGLGAVGVGSVTGLTVATEPALAFTDTMQVTSNGNDLLLDWRETYNGDVVEDSTEGDAGQTPDGPVLSLQNVQPGDTGTLSVRMRVTGGETDPPAVDPRFAIELAAAAENGRNDPELASGDDTPGVGELQNFVDVSVWYDTGTFGVDGFGARNAENDPGEGLVDPDAQGTLAEVAAALPDEGENGILLDADPGGERQCLTGDNEVTITLGWEFTSGPDVNVTQGDSVTVDLAFWVGECTA